MDGVPWAPWMSISKLVTRLILVLLQSALMGTACGFFAAGKEWKRDIKRWGLDLQRHRVMASYFEPAAYHWVGRYRSMIIWALKGGWLCPRERRAFAVPPKNSHIYVFLVLPSLMAFGGSHELVAQNHVVVWERSSCILWGVMSTTFPPCDVTEMNFWLTNIRLTRLPSKICGSNWIRRINTYPFLNVSRNHACHPVFQAGNQTWTKQHQPTWTRQHQPTTNINQLIIQYQATNQH